MNRLLPDFTHTHFFHFETSGIGMTFLLGSLASQLWPFGQGNFCPLATFCDMARCLELGWNLIRIQLSEVFYVLQTIGTNPALPKADKKR